MIKVIVLCVLLIGFTLGQCEQGCLKCSADNKCLLCDISGKFYLVKGACKFSTMANCQIMSNEGTCLQCKANHFLDVGTQLCVAIKTANVVPNCSLYGLGPTCVKCGTGFYIKNGKCTMITELVDNCDSYMDSGKCKICAKGFIINFDGTLCIADPKMTNCFAYSMLNCKSCNPGYMINQNLYFSRLSGSDSFLSAEIQTFMTGGSMSWVPVKTCQKLMDPNCLVASSADACTTCKPGYFLTAQKDCKVFPNSVLEGCSLYSSLTTCVSCQDGYYLQTPNKCTLITPAEFITDCSAYSTTANTVQCSKCSPSMFLTGNACTPNIRVDSVNIAGCQTVSLTSDTCQTCTDGLVLTTDGKKCLPAIPNCLVYGASSASSTAMTCTSCKNAFVLTTDAASVTSCVAGTIEGCLTYSDNNTCTLCDSTAFYLDSPTCKRHIPVGNCINYSSSNFNQCITCADGFFPFTLKATCKSITVIPECESYSDANTCAACTKGYYLKANQCKFIQYDFPNCAEVSSDGTACILCATPLVYDDFTLKCVPNQAYITDYCGGSTPNQAITIQDMFTADTDSCTTCKPNSYPLSLATLFTCVENTLLSAKGAIGSSVITGCTRYGVISSIVTCVECLFHLRIPTSGSRTCLLSCNPSSQSILADSLDGQYNLCVESPNTDFFLSNCSMVSRFYSTTSSALSLTCLRSTTTTSLVASFTTTNADNASMWKDIANSTVPRHQGAFFYAGIVTTTTTTTTTNHDNQSDTAKDCELFWQKVAGNPLLCLRCKWGYTAQFVSATSKTQCALITGCDTTLGYTGYSNKLNMVLSCHACTAGQFLLVTATIADDNTAATYAFTDYVDDTPMLKCVTPTANAATASVPQTVNNCMIYGWFKAGGTDPTNAKGCIACMPGFTLSANFGTCAAISGCDNTKGYMANRCSVCTQTNSGTNAVEWKALQDFNGLACLVVKSNNCLFADTVADANNAYDCLVCKPGFTLNVDKRCEMLTLPQCSDSTGSTNLYVLPTFDSVAKVATYYAVKHLANGASISGCSRCLPGFTALKMPSGEVQCANSPYVKDNTFPATSKYVTNCAKYSRTLNTGSTPAAVCVSCQGGRVPTDDGTLCVNAILNCAKAQNTPNTAKCLTCLSTHVQVNGVCVQKNIVNCVTYDTSSSVADLLCNVCAHGFVVSGNRKSCYLGNVIGCQTYNNDAPWFCNTCMKGYNLINTANSRTYCMPADFGSNCSALDVSTNTGLQGGFYTCTACTATYTEMFFPTNYATDSKILPQSICLPLNPIKNCAKYHTTSNVLLNNSLQCTQCSAGFWLEESKNQCNPRALIPPACTTFVTNADQCSVCAKGTYLSTDQKDCLPNPKGILRCSTYTNDTVCASCQPPAYLDKNACPMSTVINNCASYSANYTCTGCDGGYFLNNSTSCVQAQASNCLTFASANTCATCATGKGLKTDTQGNTSCVDHGIGNCAVASASFPFTCTECNPGYVLSNDGACALPAVAIPKCLNYDGQDMCRKCEGMSVLTVDRKACNDTAFTKVLDQNCADSQLSSSPICTKCSPGFIFVNGTCTSCTNNTYSDGCFSCNPLNQTNCIACRPGFFQTANGTCHPTVSMPPAPANSTQTPNHTHSINHKHSISTAVLLRVVALLMVIVALI